MHSKRFVSIYVQEHMKEHFPSVPAILNIILYLILAN